VTARPRHAFVVRDRALIAPLGVTAADTRLLGGTLWQNCERLLREAGLVVERVDSAEEAAERAERCGPAGAVVTHDSVGFSRSVLRHLLDAAERDERPALAAALPVARATELLAHVDGLTAVTIDGTAALAAPLAVVRSAAAAAAPAHVLLPYRELEWKFPTPVGMLGRAEEPFAATETYLCRVDHWAHVLRLNLAALVGHWFERWKTVRGRLWLLWRALLGFPWARGRLAASVRAVHRKAKVHHTAHVELSVVEEGAAIGARAVVKNSWIGKGAHIDDGAIVNATVVADGAFVASASTVFSTVLGPRSFAAQEKVQFSVFGEAAVAFSGAWFYDVNFERNVRVAHRGQVKDGGTRFLGVCVGPWSRVSGGVWIASGREVPAHALIVQPPDGVLHNIDEAAAQRSMTTVSDRALVELGPLPRQQLEESAAALPAPAAKPAK
jgi:carbonic anhydrase/acetyltransferase-like protein (isoleucine patch superfamily)